MLIVTFINLCIFEMWGLIEGCQVIGNAVATILCAFNWVFVAMILPKYKLDTTTQY